MTYRDDTYFKKYAEHAKGATEELKEERLTLDICIMISKKARILVHFYSLDVNEMIAFSGRGDHAFVVEGDV